MKNQLENLFVAGLTAVFGASTSVLAQFEGQAVAVPEPEAALVLLPAAVFLAMKERQRRARANKRDK